MNNENDIITHFSVPGTPPLFLCLLWKMIFETDRISPIAYKILERIGARALSAHLRKFCDHLVFEFANSVGGQHVNKCVDTVNDMIWKYNIVTIDRLVLCLVSYTYYIHNIIKKLIKHFIEMILSFFTGIEASGRQRVSSVLLHNSIVAAENW